MRIVFASTPGQEEEINGLIHCFYSRILPLYFTEKEILEFKRLSVLHMESASYGTLRDAFYVMASLQTIIFILEAPVPGDYHRALFEKNADNLRDYGLYFPFDYSSFVPEKKGADSIFNMYAPAANQLPV
ncbi:hypothetical protein A8F94_17120 [Bacillus sp. FJAT-27225]|uniref:DUF5365 family protein n=1 Tax=Bacillus sp. FJAT-27225 TaxID=1743144 RepID=UPI00080C205D|nr:DUF5365 family protein [Bacillus sp. FJAT-27225]OCA84422.1 hypothetical protein A8F94_17120 [Bacillus sp. FJAT-27225]